MQRVAFKALTKTFLARHHAILPKALLITSKYYSPRSLMVFFSYKFSQARAETQNITIKFDHLKEDSQFNKIVEAHGIASAQAGEYALHRGKALGSEQSPKAIKWLELAEEIYTKTKGPCKELATAIEFQARIFLEHRNFEKARDYCRRVGDICLSIGDEQGYLLAKEDVYITHIEDDQKAISGLEGVLAERKKRIGEDDPGIPTCMLKIALIKSRIGLLHDQTEIEKAIDLLGKVKASPFVLQNFYLNLAFIRINMQKFDQAASCLEKVLKNLDPEKEFERLYSTYYQLGQCYTKVKDELNALNNYLKAIQVAEKHRFSAHPGILENVAIGYYRTGQYEKAAEYFKKASGEYRNRAEATKDRKNQEAAIKTLLKAAELLRHQVKHIEDAAVAYFEAFFYCTKYFGMEEHQLTMYVFNAIGMDKDPRTSWYGEKWDAIDKMLIEKGLKRK